VDLVASTLSFRYPRGTALFDSWDCTFRTGQVTAVAGRSGSGKSTLMFMLGLMLRPSSGEILVGEVPYGHANDATRARARARLFGFVFQDAALDPHRTVLDNVLEPTLYAGRSRAESLPIAQNLLARFGVALRADAKPGQISGGQAQRIALCRALLGDPPVLLADEPTGNLDAESSAVVFAALREHATRGHVVVVVTHDHHIAAQCDRIVTL